MEPYIIIIILISWLLVFLIKGIYDKKKNVTRLQRKLKQQFGALPENNYDAGRYKYIDYYFEHKVHKGDVVDKITWDDLDMEMIFMTMNQTCTGVGEEYLYAMLHEPLMEESLLRNRDRLISQFENNGAFREKIQMILCKLGKMRQHSMYQFVDLLRKADEHKPYLDLCLMTAMIMSIVLSIFVSTSFLPTILIMVAVNMVTYYNYKNRIYFESFGYITNFSKCALELVKTDIHLTSDEMETLKMAAACIEKLGKRSWLFRQGSNIGGTLLDVFMDYVKMIFHIDLILFDITMTSLRKHDKELSSVMDTIGYIDACIAIASYRKMKADYCVPNLDKGKTVYLDAEDIYHPLIENPVVNSIHADRAVLLTGSNASGKSTFLKTVAVNALFAQTICTVLASQWDSSFFRIYSSMALKDNLMENESYFIVEIKSLKRIFNKCSDPVPMLCFIDEVLRGTNTVERIAASSQLLYRISAANTLCFAATHDIELASILESYFDNYHFQEEVRDNQVTFDYRIRKGRAVSRNAIKLLSVIGFDDAIVNAAKASCVRFETEGRWTL